MRIVMEGGGRRIKKRRCKRNDKKNIGKRKTES